jgi:hypothetical protein
MGRRHLDDDQSGGATTGPGPPATKTASLVGRLAVFGSSIFAESTVTIDISSSLWSLDLNHQIRIRWSKENQIHITVASVTKLSEFPPSHSFSLLPALSAATSPMARQSQHPRGA